MSDHDHDHDHVTVQGPGRHRFPTRVGPRGTEFAPGLRWARHPDGEAISLDAQHSPGFEATVAMGIIAAVPVAVIFAVTAVQELPDLVSFFLAVAAVLAGMALFATVPKLAAKLARPTARNTLVVCNATGVQLPGRHFRWPQLHRIEAHGSRLLLHGDTGRQAVEFPAHSAAQVADLAHYLRATRDRVDPGSPTDLPEELRRLAGRAGGI